MKDLTLILVRFSDEEQIGGVSFEYQESECRECEAKTPHLDGLAKTVIVLKDEALSRTFVLERPAVKEALRLAVGERVARVIVWRYDRLGGDEAETFLVLKEFESIGVEVLSATESSDRLLRGIKIVLSAEEIRNISIRTRAAMKQIAHEGFPTGGPVPFGLKPLKIPDPTGRRDKKGNPKMRTQYKRGTPEEIKRVEDVFGRAGEKSSDRDIADYFNGRNYPPPRGGPNGWDSSTIKAIREREVYKGTLIHGRYRFVSRPNGKRVPVRNPRDKWIVIEECPNIEPLVTPDVWERAQQNSAEARSRGGKGGRGRQPKHPLTRIVKCGECGANLVASPSSRKGHRYVLLRCGWRVRRGKAVCQNCRAFRADRVFDAILDVLHRDLFTQENIKTLIDLVAEEVARACSMPGNDRANIEEELRQTGAKMDRVVHALELAQESIDALIERAKAHKKKIAELRARLQMACQAVEPPSSEEIRGHVVRAVGRIGELVKNGSPPEVRAELQRHLKDVRLFSDGRLRVEGTLEGLLQGATVARIYGSGGGI